ncbi:MAG TPA: ATP-binding protein [Pyrinomonadaceae bacterium]|nr:ATP-binding protein [Pyrinomonadaceae bacterium]
MNKQRLYRPYAWFVIGLGAVLLLFCAYRLPSHALDLRFFILFALTLGVTSRVSIPIPGVKSEISVSDTFVFLVLLLYGGEAAAILGAAEAVLVSRRISRKKLTILFNSAVMAVATCATVWTVQLSLGQVAGLQEGFTARFVSAVCLMAIVQYLANSGLVAVGEVLKHGRPFFETWRKHYLWTSITYVAGASAAGIIARLMSSVGTAAVIAATPLIAIVYLTYRTYLKNVETSALQAEQAERHVAELSHYIAEQERIREQFSQIEKLSALGELASGVAHDFNNTLAGILGRAQLLMRTNDPEKIRRGLQIIIKTAEDGAKTVRRIQDFARQRRDHDFEAVPVEQLLNDVSEITRPRWRDRAEAVGIHIDLVIDVRTKALARGDGSELREVLVNMVFNAVDAMPSGGRLTLSAEDAGDRVRLSVGDTGMGMSPEVRSRIFDPFYTTKGRAGLGLGLAVSYGIIRRHEGEVEVETEVGRGTTFRITLPRVAAEENEQKPSVVEAPAVCESEPVPPSVKKKATILVADDEPHVRELLCEILDSEGFETVAVASGREALALFDARRFDALFTDIGMPGMSGWELAEQIRARDGSLPVAVITGWGEAVGSNEQKAAGVDWVVAKPFSAGRICEIAAEVARRHQQMNEETALSLVA